MSEEWVETTLGGLCDVQVGPAFKSEVFRSAPDGTRLLRGINLGPQGTRWDEVYLWPDERLEEFRRFLLNEGDVCIAMDATFTSGGQIRAARMASIDLPALLVQRVARLRARPDSGLDQDFLALVVGSGAFRGHLSDRQTGAFAPHISATDLKSFLISLPPLPVQRRIVDLMAHLDNHLANLQTERDAAEALLAHLRGRLMESSEQVLLSELAEPSGIQIGPFGSQLHAREYSETGVPVVMPKNLINGRIEEAGIKRVPPEVAERLSRHLLRPGDIVFPRRGDLSKRALVTESQDGWLCGTGCIRFRPATDVDGSLVFETLSGAEVTDWLVEHAVGTTMLNLNTEIVSKLPIADPSTGSKELSEASRLQAEVCEALRRECADVRELRNAVLSRVVNGSMAIPDSYDSLLPEVA